MSLKLWSDIHPDGKEYQEILFIKIWSDGKRPKSDAAQQSCKLHKDCNKTI